MSVFFLRRFKPVQLCALCAFIVGAFALPAMQPLYGAENSGALPASDLSSTFGDLKQSAIVKLSLQDAIDTALQSNLGLRLSRINDQNATLNAFATRNKFNPTLTASLTQNDSIVDDGMPTTTSHIAVTKPFKTGGSATVSVTHTDSPGTDSPRANTVAVSVSQPLLRGSGEDDTLSAVRTNEIERMKQRANLERAAQKLIFSVTKQYFNVLLHEMTLEVNRRSVIRAQKFLDITIAREHARQTSLLEVQKARVQLADRKVAVLRSLKSLEEARDNIKDTLNMSMDANIRFQSLPISLIRSGDGTRRELKIDNKAGTVSILFMRETDEDTYEVIEKRLIFQGIPFNETTILKAALASRIEVINARRSIQQSWIAYQKSLNAARQDVTLTASYNRTGNGGTVSDSLDFLEDSFSVGLSYRYTFGQAPERVGLEKQRLAIRRTEINLETVEKGIQREVRNLVRDLEESRQLVLLNASKVEQAQRVVDANQIRFDRGLVDSFDIIQSEDDLLKAETDFLTQLVNYRILVVKVDEVIGKPTGRIRLADQ